MKVRARASELKLRAAAAYLSLSTRVGSFVGRVIRILRSGVGATERLSAAVSKRLRTRAGVSDQPASRLEKPRQSAAKLSDDTAAHAAKALRTGAQVASVFAAELARIRFSYAKVRSAVATRFGKGLTSPVGVSSRTRSAVGKSLNTGLRVLNPITYQVGRFYKSVAQVGDQLLGFQLGKGIRSVVPVVSRFTTEYRKTLAAIGVDAAERIQILFFARRSPVSQVGIDTSQLQRDLSVKTPTKETPGVGDEGTLSIHDYSEITYFLEDYVGEARYL